MANSHKHSPWRKTVLIPFWSIQLLFMLVFIALMAVAEGVLANYYNGDGDWDSRQFDNINVNHVVHVATDIIVPVYISVCAVCVVLTVTEIILLARHKLRPLAFLIMNVIKTAIWTVIFALDIASAVTAGGRTTSTVGMIIDAILLLSFWIPLIYGSVIYHRFRREKKTYKPVDGPVNTSYESQFPKSFASPEIHSDLEAVDVTSPQPYGGDARYESYRASSYTPKAPAMETFENRGMLYDGRSDIPQVYVEHHDGESYELDSRRELR